MHAIWAWIKEHVWLTVGLIVGLIVFWKLARGSGAGASSVAAAPGVDPTVVQASLQSQELQAAASAQTQQTAAQLQAEQDTNATNIALANIAAQLQTYQTSAGLQATQENIAAQTSVAEQTNTLQAAVAAQEMATQTNMAQIQANTENTVVNAQAATEQALIQEQPQLAQIQGNTAVNVALANRPKVSSSLCMLTNACVEVLGKDDDCWELTMLRKLRDDYVQYQPNGGKDIEAYYDLAPRLIAAINARDDSRYQWERIHRQYIVPCSRRVHIGDYSGAVAVYRDMLADVQRFLPTPAPDGVRT